MKRREGEFTNLLIALSFSVVILTGWQYFIETPRKKAESLALKVQVQEQTVAASRPSEPEAPLKSRAELLSESPRLPIRSPELSGSIALKGLRFDDLALVRYRETLEPDSPKVVLLSPQHDANGYFAEFGWLKDTSAADVPGPQALWKADGAALTPAHPILLSWTNSQGVTFTARVALDEKYLFTVTQSARDAQGHALAVQPYALINRNYDIKAHPALGILHEGPLGVFDGTLKETPYKKIADEKREAFAAQGGWLGITDKYWLTALAPAGQTPFTAEFLYYPSGRENRFQAGFVGAAGRESVTRFFAGAKELSVLDAYAARYRIPLFDRAVDFGMFYFLTKPIFIALTYFYALVGNFGVAILLLTVIVKLLMYPLASKSFKAMNQMKTLQPKMAEIRERHKADKLKMNQEVMELYKREKVNPASGCLPLFIQIPVFFSLYKVLYVTIEMRHAPFFGWIHDLSVRDPTNIFTLFGLLDWNPPSALHIGIWPLIMCLTMVIQQAQSPPPPDPVQAKVMKLLPFIFLFLFASVPAGLVIYWCWSNTLTILQQGYIKRTHAPKKPARA